MASRMPRRGYPVTIQHVYIADGFADDCDELIHRCSRVDILNYQTFCVYYKEMNFASMFQGRTSNAEIAELSEELLHIAKYYMVLDTSNFEESVAGVFLVYALLNLQPYPRFAPLRLVPDDLPALARIERVARRDRRLDVLYTLGSILTRGPVQCHVEARPRGMESSIRKYLEGFCNIDITGVRPKGVYFRQNEELDIIRDMTGIFKRYSQAKGKVPGLQRRVLSYSNDNLAVELGASLKKVITGTVDEVETPMEHHNAVQEIKKRAMQNVVSTVRHLDSAQERNKSPEKKPQATTSKQTSKAKRPSPVKTPNKKRKLKTLSTSEETEPLPEENLSEDEVISEEKEDKVDEQEIHVEIDDLPSKITTETDGRLVVIEIIDEMRKDIPEIENEKESDPLPSLTTENEHVEETIDEINTQKDLPPLVTKESGFVEIEICSKDPVVKYDKKEDNKGKAKPRKRRAKKEDKKQNEEVFKRPLRASARLQPVLKRDQKKPILKSKFKKMGMLELANFKEAK